MLFRIRDPGINSGQCEYNALVRNSQPLEMDLLTKQTYSEGNTQQISYRPR